MTAIMVAPNGARRGKADHPALPITPEALAAEAEACRAAGAAAMHLHVRDAEGLHSLDVERYRAALTAIRARVGDWPVQVTTETVGRYGPSAIHGLLEDLRPAAASASLRDLAPEPADEAAAAARFAWAHAAGVGLQHIVYAPEELPRLARLLPDHEEVSLLFVLGRYADDLTADPADLIGYLQALEAPFWRDRRVVWMVCAFGRTERAALVAAGALGGHARVGFENSLLRPDGAQAAGNAAQVGDLATALRGIGLSPAPPDGAAIRSILGLRPD